MSSPVLSILTLAHSGDGLESTAAALAEQVDPRWEWILLLPSALRAEVEQRLGPEPRRRVLTADTRSPAAALGTALTLAGGTFIGRCEPGDRPGSQFVALVADEAAPDGWLYADESRPNPDWVGTAEWRKPDFGPELLRSQPYPGRAVAVSRALALAVGGFDPTAGSAAWYDLVLRVAERSADPVHPDGPHYQRLPDAGGQPPPWPDGTADDNCRAVAKHCARAGIGVDAVEPIVVAGRLVGQRIRRRRRPSGRLSVIIPTRCSSSVIHGFPRTHIVDLVAALVQGPDGPDEIVVVHDEPAPAEVLDRLRELAGERLVLQPFREPFNFARKCNVGALRATGELLCFLNDDIQPVTADWLGELKALLADPGVGAVGPKLLFSDGTLQHAGHEYSGSPNHFLFGYDRDSLARGGLAQVTGERSGVTAACLLMRSSDFVRVGGFSEAFGNNYNDVDLNLKLRHLGKRILYCPHAVLFHFESQTRQPTVTPTETMLLDRRWGWAMRRDPYVGAITGGLPGRARAGKSRHLTDEEGPDQ